MYKNFFWPWILEIALVCGAEVQLFKLSFEASSSDFSGKELFLTFFFFFLFGSKKREEEVGPSTTFPYQHMPHKVVSGGERRKKEEEEQRKVVENKRPSCTRNGIQQTRHGPLWKRVKCVLILLNFSLAACSKPFLFSPSDLLQPGISLSWRKNSEEREGKHSSYKICFFWRKHNAFSRLKNVLIC